MTIPPERSDPAQPVGETAAGPETRGAAGPDARPGPRAGAAEPDRGPEPPGAAPEPGGAAQSGGTVAEPAGAAAEPEEAGVPTAEAAARRARAERAVRGTLSGALVLEAITVLFVPRAIAPLSEDGLTGARLTALLALAGALVLAAGLQRRRAGIVLGTVLQVAVIATGVLVGAMYVLGLLFGAVWVYLLRMRRDVLGPARPPGEP